MNAKIILTRNSPVRSVLVNETTGKELYRIDTPYRFVGRVTRVFRRDPATPSAPNPIPQSRDGDEPHEDRVSEELELVAIGRTHDSGEVSGIEEEGGVDGAGEETLGEDSPLVDNEIARIYWKWFSSPRIIFEGKIRTRAEYMPLKSRLRIRTYVFNHKGVAYRWSPGPMGRPKLVVDSSETFVAQFHPNPFSKKKAYLEVTPAGMAMLDHIVVTFIPVEVQRRK